MPKKPRDYDKEYSSYHAKPEQRQRRSERNQARREMIKKKGAAAVKGKDVHHVGAAKTGSLKGTPTKIMSKKANRSKK